MRLNPVEYAAMNNPVRRAMIRRWELPVAHRMLRSHGADLRGKALLDVGCGEGASTEALARRFRPSRLVAFDLMPEQIARARRRMTSRGYRAEVHVGDATAIEEPDASFDAVFELGILHHVPGWRQALGEIARVLVPGGWFLSEELSGRFVDFSDLFLMTDHPDDVRLEWRAFRGEMEAVGLEVVAASRMMAMPFAMRFLARKR